MAKTLLMKRITIQTFSVFVEHDDDGDDDDADEGVDDDDADAAAADDDAIAPSDILF